MSGRLAGLKDSLKAEREPPPKEAPPNRASTNGVVASTRAKAREGKRALGGYFSPELLKAMNQIALDEDTTVQALLGEAVDLLMRDRGKHPFGER